MPITLIDLTFDVADILGADYEPGRTKVWIETNIEHDAIVDPDGNTIRLGPTYVKPSSAGTGTFEGLVPTDAATNPTGFQYLVTVDYPAKGAPDRKGTKWRSGWFSLTTTSDLADVVVEQAVPPTYLTTVTTLLDGYVTAAQTAETNAEAAQAAAEAARDDAVDISGISTSDGVVSALINTVAGPLTQAALSDTIAAQTAPGAAGACIGDSWFNRNGPYLYGTGDPSQYYPHLGIFRHAAVALGQRVSLRSNFAVSGKRADEVLAAQVPQVLALDPRPAFCTVLAGTNDLTQGRTSAQIIASLDDIYTALTDAGIIVFAFTVPPSDTEYDATETTRLHAVNDWIKAQPRARNGVYVTDAHTILTAKAAPDGGPITGVLADEAGVHIHPTSKGAALVGAGLAQIMAPLFPPVDVFPGPGNPNNLGPGPFMVGTGGSKGAGVTGNVATGWDASPIGACSVVASKVARTDGLPGEWQQFVVTSGSIAMSNAAWFTGFTAGDTIKMFVEFETDASMDAATTRFDCFVSVGGHGAEPAAVLAGGLLETPGTPGADDPSTVWTKLPRSGVIETPTLVVPSGAVNGDCYAIRAYNATGGTFRIGRVAIVKGAPLTVVAG